MSRGGPPTVAVTGATGWIGRALCTSLAARAIPHVEPGRDVLEGRAPWPAIDGGTVVHLAAIAHRDASAVDPASYDRVNRALAVSAARDARDAGARRFVFVSTAAVMGPGSTRPFVESDPPAPADPYARAKLAAESELATLLAGGRTRLVVLRPPLVYGPGVRANFLALLRIAASPWPLPLGRAHAPRSAIYIDNFVDALVHAARSPAVVGGTWFVRDDRDRSVAQWVAAIRALQGRPPGLVHVPAALWGGAARVVGRADLHERLFRPLLVDDGAFKATRWRPPVDPDTALARTLAWYAASGDDRPDGGASH
ncbi:MAG: NAD-dependent epimerase/dehydratase family protein [Burkholderiaceae bacterium]|jgi:UDP-glucose 4-epimerase|nr:NAD-dependent epimerase/dehydratase family protein [Burkholderiales bacterium]MCZ8106212.1 NAD-dependent epimerase/dehydratase family protein [Burkholderiales bacterium]MCZ8337165.1 NAD-dependent epimerase/dehydratase family protein [Burkholderiaceae bacterium]